MTDVPPQRVEKIVFVSGCYDVLHGGHLEFFSRARALGDRLVVSFAGDESLRAHKGGRIPSIPTPHKKASAEEWYPGMGHQHGEQNGAAAAWGNSMGQQHGPGAHGPSIMGQHSAAWARAAGA